MKLHGNPIEKQVPAAAYSVKVNGQTLDLFMAGGPVQIKDTDSPYAFGSFDMEGDDVLIEITSQRDLSKVEILPENNSLQVMSHEKNSLVLKAGKPFIISIEPDGRINMPLLLFGKAPEINKPQKSDPNVIWFSPGEHEAGKIVLTSNQTLYLESGSLVHGVLIASGNNIRVCGRGVLSQEKYPRRYVDLCMDFCHCDNLVIEGIISKDPCLWNLVLRDCKNVKIDSIALCGGRMINDDAVDICNCQNVKITNCFFRAQDDIIAVKGEADLPSLPNNTEVHKKFSTEIALDQKYYGKERAVESIEADNCVFWNDSANVFRIGYECTAPYFRNLKFHDIEIIHTAKVIRPHTEFWSNNVFMLQASCAMPMEDMKFERINIHSDGLGMLFISIRSEECNIWKKPGTIRNCLFKDIVVNGKVENFTGDIFLQCKDKTGKIEGITLENISFFGKKLTGENTLVSLDGDVKKPEFK